MGFEVTPHPDEREDLLLQIPEYREGRLSPAQAHKISLLLKEDARFREEAAREERLVEALAGMKAMPLPRGLVAKSVHEAVGDAATTSWLGLDTLLVALGVGVGCAALAQFFSGKVNLVPKVGEWIGNLAGVAVQGSVGSLLGGVGLVSVALVLGGIFLAYRVMRSRD